MNNLNFQEGIAPIIAVVILAVILIGGGAYYFKQQQIKPASKSNVTDATANWKTYENKELGFSIKYPQDWEINNSCSLISGNKQYEKVQFLCTLNVQSFPYKPPGGDSYIHVNPDAPSGLIVNVSAYSNPKNLDIEKFLTSAEGLNYSEKSSIWIISKIKIGNKEFIKETVKNKDEDQLDAFYIKGDNDKAYSIDGFMFAKNGDYQKLSSVEIDNYAKIYEQILSTFKFTQ